ncbi:hypothetical protein [Dechloromonas denitrificans]|uniref:hypothetical protein n=1 Tax=Dechloromonas denitrificans TaxID=281362 RepID=UPI0012FC17D5|nr:hypothetical protein [Dechloromonas denitrificans]
MLSRFPCAALLSALLLVSSMPAIARGGGGMGGGTGGGMGGGSMGGGASSVPYMPPILGDDGHRYEFFEPTKLEPKFPDGYRCSSPTAYYGSPSDSRALSLMTPPGTPLRAIAVGEVIAKGKTPNADGAFLWLRLAPEDTGHPFWTFVKYQRLQDIPSIEIGSRTTVGEVIAVSGETGTSPLTTVYGPSPEFRMGGKYQSVVKARDGKLDDPMIFYISGIANPQIAHSASEEPKQIAVSVIGPEDMLLPTASNSVWPVACSR